MNTYSFSKRNIYTVAMVVLLAATMVGCSEKKEAVAKKVELVRVESLRKQVITRDMEYSTSLVANEEVNVAPASAGKIDKIFVNVGSRVKQGELVARMDPTQLNTTRIQFNNLKTDMQRLETLRQAGTVSQQTYDQTKVQYDLTKENLVFLEKNVNLRAPFSGIISVKNFENGELYSGSPSAATGKAAIVTLVQINPLKANLFVPESFLPQLKQGSRVSVKCDTYPDQDFSAHIARIYPTVDAATRSVQIELKVNNAGEKLRPGMFCRTTIDFGKVKALVVPSQAVLRMQGSNERYVFVEKNGKAQRVIVTLGKRFDDQIEIISTQLNEGDNLIVTGQNRLIDGVAVKTVK
ncbi:MAG: macA 2 [Bacteroidetes bacterium]|nr:macA 2 [Bacteroidota bacterium]